MLETPEMTVQLTIDCSDPRRMVAFWAEALGYVPEPPPAGHATWRAHWVAAGVPEEELPPGAGDVPESIVDPSGRGPRVWFQQVPEPKVAKNRWHFDLKVGGGREVPWRSARGGSGRRWNGSSGREPPCCGSSRIRTRGSAPPPCGTPRATSSTSSEGRRDGARTPGRCGSVQVGGAFRMLTLRSCSTSLWGARREGISRAHKSRDADEAGPASNGLQGDLPGADGGFERRVTPWCWASSLWSWHCCSSGPSPRTGSRRTGRPRTGRTRAGRGSGPVAPPGTRRVAEAAGGPATRAAARAVTRPRAVITAAAVTRAGEEAAVAAPRAAVVAGEAAAAEGAEAEGPRGGARGRSAGRGGARGGARHT